MDTTKNHNDDYDSPWKEGMELYFKELMQFFFPDIARNEAREMVLEALDTKFSSSI